MKKIKLFFLLSLCIFSCIPFKESLDDPFTKEGLLKHYFTYLLNQRQFQEAKGVLDLEFGINGIVKTDINGYDDIAYSLFLQPDGKILLGGHSKNNYGNFDFALVRYNTNGSLDSEFGINSIVTTDIFANGDDYGYSLFLQPDGKILLGGFAYSGVSKDLALVRYNSNGSLDNSFGSTGIVTTNISSTYDDFGYSLFLQPDGKILLGGFTYNGTNRDFALVRYNTNGSLDSEFDTDGKVTTNINPDNDYAYSVFLQPDGKILLGGNTHNGTNFDFALVRYEHNGILDYSFGNNGKIITDISNGDDYATTIIVQPNGKILVAGYSYNGVNYDYAIIRYHTDGSIDTSFGNNGIVIIPIGTDQNNEAHSIALQPDGKVLLGGYYDADSTANTNYDFVLVRIK